MDIFIEGLEVYGYHGVAPEERVLGQRFYFDVRLTVEDCRAALTDRVEDAIDYTEVIDLIIDVATTESYSLLERLARVTAESILRKFAVDEVWVQVVKPHPPVACALTGVSASIELQRSDLEG
jgi:7,8-dihydroneopterin aldolase/epimerase/oxygenase